MVSISNEIFFQILNILILVLIPVILIITAVRKFTGKNKSVDNKILELEKRINDLENK